MFVSLLGPAHTKIFMPAFYQGFKSFLSPFLIFSWWSNAIKFGMFTVQKIASYCYDYVTCELLSIQAIWVHIYHHPWSPSWFVSLASSMLGKFWSIPNSSSWAFVSKDTLGGLGTSSGHWDQKASNGLLRGWVWLTMEFCVIFLVCFVQVSSLVLLINPYWHLESPWLKPLGPCTMAYIMFEISCFIIPRLMLLNHDFIH